MEGDANKELAAITTIPHGISFYPFTNSSAFYFINKKVMVKVGK